MVVFERYCCDCCYLTLFIVLFFYFSSFLVSASCLLPVMMEDSNWYIHTKIDPDNKDQSSDCQKLPRLMVHILHFHKQIMCLPLSLFFFQSPFVRETPSGKRDDKEKKKERKKQGLLLDEKGSDKWYCLRCYAIVPFHEEAVRRVCTYLMLPQKDGEIMTSPCLFFIKQGKVASKGQVQSFALCGSSQTTTMMIIIILMIDNTWLIHLWRKDGQI